MGVSRRRCEVCGCMRKKAHEKKALKDDNECVVYTQKDDPKTYPWKASSIGAGVHKISSGNTPHTKREMKRAKKQRKKKNKNRMIKQGILASMYNKIFEKHIKKPVVKPAVSNPMKAEKKSGKKQGFFSKLFRRKTV